LVDNVPDDIKVDRMNRMIALNKTISQRLNKELEGTKQLVLIEGVHINEKLYSFSILKMGFLFSFFQDSKRSKNDFQGRTDGYVKCIMPKQDHLEPGDYCVVDIKESNSLTLKGQIIEKSSISQWK
jgi:tRNA A37 methylthiotransferase MiaB